MRGLASAYRPASSAAIADLVPPEGRARAFGLLYWVANLGMSVSTAGGGWLAGRGFGLLFQVDAATTLVFALLVWWRVPETRPAPAAPTAARLPGYREALADRELRALILLQFLFLVPFLQFMVALPVHMARLGLGPSVYGRVLSVNGVAIVLLQPLGLYGVLWGVAMLAAPWLGAAALERLGPRALFAACLALCLLVSLGHLAAGPARRRRLAAAATPSERV